VTAVICGVGTSAYAAISEEPFAVVDLRLLEKRI
jgi:hypothetical protein